MRQLSSSEIKEVSGAGAKKYVSDRIFGGVTKVISAFSLGWNVGSAIGRWADR